MAISYTTLTGKVRVDANITAQSNFPGAAPDTVQMQLFVDGVAVPTGTLGLAVTTFPPTGSGGLGQLNINTIIKGLTLGAHTFQLHLTSSNGATVQIGPSPDATITLADSLN